MKCQKLKKYFYIFLSGFIAFCCFMFSCLGSYASTLESTNSGVSSGWSENEQNAYLILNLPDLIATGYKFIVDGDTGWSDLRAEVFDLWTARALAQNMTFDEWVNRNTTWYYMNGVPSQESVTGVQLSDDMASDIQVAINNYIGQNPLGYTECYIKSYNFLSPSLFSSYGQYASVKERIKSNGAPCAINSYTNPNGRWMYICPLDSSRQISYIGSTLNGSFSNVHAYYDWSIVSNPTKYQINANGTFTQYGSATLQNYTLLNNTLSSDNGDRWTIFSSQEKDELVYVFSTLNALKNYNSGLPQPYYMGTGFGSYNNYYGQTDLKGNNMGYYYNNVVNNVQAGWSPDQVLALVDKIASIAGSGSSSNEKDTGKMWDRIGNAIGNLIDGIVSVITTVIEKLTDALLSIIHLLTGYTDDNGVFHEGLFTKLTSLVNSGFSSFISSIFSWMPEEIVTLLTATLVFGIFFGIFKLLRR